MTSVAHFTLAQYELMAEAGAFDGKHHQRVELIRGEITEMEPISVRHAAVVDRLTRLSTRLLGEDLAEVRIQGTLRIPKLESAPEPDVLWLAPKDYFQGHPEPEDVLLLIEVSEGTLAYDMGDKALLYAEAAIRDYWVVNLTDDCVEVMRDPQPTGYQSRRVVRDDEEVRPLAFPDVVLKPSAMLRRG